MPTAFQNGLLALVTVLPTTAVRGPYSIQLPRWCKLPVHSQTATCNAAGIADAPIPPVLSPANGANLHRPSTNLFIEQQLAGAGGGWRRGSGGHGGGHGGGGGGNDGSGNGDAEQPPLLHVFAAAWRLYSNALDHQPLAAKALTAGCVGGLGDLLSQRVAGHDIVDVERLLAVVVDGLCVSGPGLHVGYALLERRIPCAGRGPLRNVALQLLIDECIFDPAFIGAFFFSTGFVERQHPWRDTLPHLRAAYWPTLRGAMLTSAAFTPIQFVSFRYLPVKCRVLVVNLCDVLWYAAVSLGRHSGREASA